MKDVGGPEKDLCFGWGEEDGTSDQLTDHSHSNLLAARVLGHGLGALAHGVLGQLTGEKETDGRLDLAAGDGRPLVVVGKTGGLGGDTLEDVVHEGVHDGHGLGADTSVGVDLLQDLVDVDRVRFLPLLTFLLAITLGDGLGGLAGLFGSFSRGLGWHGE